MKKTTRYSILCLLVLVMCAAVFGYEEGSLLTLEPRFKGVPGDKQLLMYGRGGNLEDSGVAIATITNSIANSTSAFLDVAEINATTNGPNQFARLDENGKISTNAFNHITVYFTGGEYQP